MLPAITAILLFQLAGELLAASLRLPLPGPVIGMVLLFLFFLLRGAVPEGIGRVGDGLLSHLSLLFVPAGAGIMLHLSRLQAEALPIGAALVLSTLATIAATAAAMRLLSKRTKP